MEDIVHLETQEQTAKRLGLNPNTLARWRMTGLQGPKFIKIGRSVRYDPADVQAWLETQKVPCPTATAA